MTETTETTDATTSTDVADGAGESDAARLEALWSGPFGDAYTARNAMAGDARLPFWRDLVTRHGVRSALEVGCGVGANLRLLADLLGPHAAVGVDVNDDALVRLRTEAPTIDALWARARDLPFRDRSFDLVLTCAVLIHQPAEVLPVVMAEMVRTSARLVLTVEYEADVDHAKAWRGQAAALFKRPFGDRMAATFPELERVDGGFLPRDTTPFDDMTWHLFRRRNAGR